MRARLFQFARFAVYAVIVVVGLGALFGRQATGHPAKADARWVNGRTTQRLPVSIRIDDHRVTHVLVRWEARCAGGPPIVHDSVFAKPDLERRGQAFAARTSGSRLAGEAVDGVVRGSAGFEFGACDSGTIGFALDL